jgi:hypothetical protein
MKLAVLVVVYIATFVMGFLLLVSSGDTIERMILSDAPYARTPEERDRIVTKASATRLGIESSPSIIYISIIKSTTQSLATMVIFNIFTTIILLFYSDMNGSLIEYAAAVITPVWLLAAANVVNAVLKLLLTRISASVSFVLFIRPFDWQNVWQVLIGRLDVFFIAYLISTGIGCAAVAKIKRSEAILLVTVVWFALYFTAIIFGIDPAVSF